VKIEIRCGTCGRGQLVDDRALPAGVSGVLCQGCGTALALPSAADTARPAAPPKAAAAVEDVVCPRCGMHFQPGDAPAPSATGARPAVLVVEDMAYFQEMAREALGSKYEVRCARSVAEARKMLASEPVDVILLDLVLGDGEDGLSLLRGLPSKPCPVLVFTAQDESDLYGARWDELRALGADDLVFKGINTGEMLVRKVDELLSSELK
jgi:CheY-like chemotaxis protein